MNERVPSSRSRHSVRRVAGDDAVALDDEDVVDRIAVHVVGVVAGHALGGDDLLDAGGVAGALVGRGHADVVLGGVQMWRNRSPGMAGGSGTSIVVVEPGAHRHSVPPYLASMCLPTDLWMAFQRLRSSAWARGSPLRSAKASSRSSLRWLSSRSTRERPVVERAADRAARLALVAAVAEAAGRGQRVDVVERRLDALVRAGDLERADAGRVDEQGAAGQHEQLAMGRRVAAARVVVADGGGRLALLAEQRVDQGGLADAGRAEHDRGPAGAQVLAEVRDVVAGQGAEDDDGHAGGDGLDRDEPALEVVGDVGLVEDDDRADAARPGDGQVALQPAQVEVVVEARDDEGDVDVGRDDLLVGQVAGASAGSNPRRCARTTTGAAGPRR